MRNRPGLTMGVGLAVAFLLVACGRTPDSAGDAGEVGTVEDQPEAPADSGLQTEESATVVAADTSLGMILVDGNGLALYILTEDLLNTPSCYGECQQSWPPLLTIGAPEAGEGIDSEKLGVATRHDGTFQVSYAGKPLYLHIGDATPGDTSGHGKDSVWLALAPSGEPLSVVEGGAKSDEESPAKDQEYNPDDSY